LREQAVNAGDAYVGDEFDRVAHEAGGDDGFFGDGKVAGAGADNGDGALPLRNVRALGEGDGAGGLVKFCSWLNGLDGEEHFMGGTCGEDVASMLGHAGKDGSYLRGGFARGEDDFRHAGAEGAMMIDLGEADVLERQIAQAIECVVYGGAAFANIVEQGFNAAAIHQSLPFPQVVLRQSQRRCAWIPA